MKELFLLLLLLVGKSIFAQINEQDLIDNFYKYSKKNVQWKSKSNIKSSSNDSTKIKLLLSDSINHMHYCFEENGFSYYKNDFYFIDLDQDKIDEIIYNGRICSGYETESVVVFKKNNLEYKQILKVSGKITGITFNNELIINDYPCCSEIWQSIFCYKFTNDNLESIGSVSFFIDDDLYKKKYKLKIIEDKTFNTLDTIFYYPQSSILDFYSEGEYLFFAQLKKDTDIQIYNVFIDNNNTKWYFGKFRLEDLTIYGWHKHKKGVVFAWIKDM